MDGGFVNTTEKRDPAYAEGSSLKLPRGVFRGGKSICVIDFQSPVGAAPEGLLL